MARRIDVSLSKLGRPSGAMEGESEGAEQPGASLEGGATSGCEMECRSAET